MISIFLWWIQTLAQHRTEKTTAMLRMIGVLLHLVLLVPDCPAGPTLVREKATRTCSDLPEEVLEQMFGRLSVGMMSAFQHALQLEPRVQLNQSCPNRTWSQADGTSRLPANLLSISPWTYRYPSCSCGWFMKRCMEVNRLSQSAQQCALLITNQ